MTSIRSLGFLLFLFLQRVSSEMAEPMFRELGNNIELGYCFDVDYIVVYRFTPEGEELLGNSSANTPITPPVDLQGRIQVKQQPSLLGLQISRLTHMDSGTYRKECWTNHTLVSQLTQQLLVCDEEVESEEIIVKEGTTTTELLCNSPSARLEGTSVRWYYEMYPVYKLTLFLDSSVSLKPLVEELQSVVEVRDRGAMLVLDNSLLESNNHFYCLVINGDKCLSYQNLYTLGYSGHIDIYASKGEKVVLNCPFSGRDQHWETPLGHMNDTSKIENQIYISSGDKDFSLVIPSVSDESGGEYSCISSANERQYSLVLCHTKTSLPHQKVVSEGEDVVLNCDTDQGDHTVLWYRQQASLEQELIYDSNIDNFQIPEDLRGKLALSNTGDSLTISNVEMKNKGLYFCVVLAGSNTLEENDYFIDNYDEEPTVEDNFYEVESWNNSHIECILKQDTFLIINHVRGKSSPSSDQPVPTYIIASIVVVIVRKKKAKPKEATSNQDPACTQGLTSGV
ncbi:hypothetical protein Q5P01_012212 [Channa striata]|uniref:Ig-like domain-containing protein n=1 Tax=Channa striata TaxID=64152 RepID=A0AA88MN19_CHASR|nr:hypothetical protein Q5P01_012212 [Channa striata]